MDKPNDIDYAIYDARLEGLNQMYLAAVEAYRQGLIEALCRFTREFAPMRVHAVRLIADMDWRWTFDAFVDEAGNEIEPEFGDDFYFDDLFSSSYLSQLDDFYKRSTGYVYVMDKVFTELTPAEYAEAKESKEGRA